MKLSAPQFWRVRENQYKLVITICGDCGKKVVFKRPTCPYCGSGRVEYAESAGVGVVEEFTKVYFKRDSSEDRLPEVVGVVRLGEGVRVVGEIVSIRDSEVREGMEVEAVLRKYVSDDPYGIIYYGIKFKPV
ncbi:MAG: Zn-ribbon domain-containing OB-fold protein [Sulfolobales archaeon]|nr:Zn-ribbon domain-containing OB-fold protein [Sulfolobales archaeon]